jgi:transglutaminase-like putative cysteine protease
LAEVFVFMAIVAATVTAVRWITRRWGPAVGGLAPGSSGLLAGAIALTARYTPDNAIVGLVPTPTSLRDLGDLIALALTAIQIEIVPVTRPQVIVPLIAALFAVSTVVVLLLAVDLAKPALIGLVVAAPWAFVIGLDGPIAWGWATATVICFLALLAWGGERTTVEWPIGLGVAVIAISLLAGTIGSPLIASLPGWGQGEAWMRQWRQTESNHVDLGLDVSTDLLEQSSTLFLRTRLLEGEAAVASDPGGQRLSLESRYSFDGTTWAAAPEATGDAVPVDYSSGVPWWGSTTAIPAVDPQVSAPGQPLALLPLDPAGQPDPLWPATSQREIVIEGLSQSQIPLTTGPRLLTLLTADGAGEVDPLFSAASYHPVSDSLTQNPPLAQGTVYDLVTWHADPQARSSASVPSAQEPVGAISNEDWYESALALPDTPHMADIAAFTQGLIDEAAANREPLTDVEKLETLAAFFHGNQFVYDLSVPVGRSGDELWDFLQNRRGFCAQYATTMAIMARTLAIPTRVTIGFVIPASQVDENGVAWSSVTGANAHAWPEAYLDGVGWVPFEPTPGASIVAPAPIAGTTAPSESPLAVPTIDDLAPTAEPVTPTTAPGADIGAADDSLAPATVKGIVALVLLAGLIALTAALVWRDRHRSLSAAEAWETLREEALLRGVVEPGDTIRRTTEILAPTLTGDAAGALRQLAQAAESERYEPPDRASTSDPAQVRAWLEEIQSGRPFG